MGRSMGSPLPKPRTQSSPKTQNPIPPPPPPHSHATRAGVPPHSPLGHGLTGGEEGDGEKKATAAASASGRGDGEKAPAARPGMTRLPEQEVTQILSTDPRSIEPYTVDALRNIVQELRSNAPEAALRAMAKVQNECTRKRYVVFQNWVRGELDAKGYVEVPDEFIRDREEAQKQQLGRLLGQPHLCLPNSYCTTVEDDGGEEFVFSLIREETESGEDDEEESDEEDGESDEEHDD